MKIYPNRFILYDMLIKDAKTQKLYTFNASDTTKTIVNSELADLTYDEEDDIDLSSIMMEVDGMDVTGELDITQDLITYIPPNGFTIGSHSLLFFVRDKMGNEAPSAHWTFFIKEVKVDVKKPWLADTKIKGMIDYESEFDTFSGKDQPENRPLDTQKPRVKLTFKRKSSGGKFIR